MRTLLACAAAVAVAVPLRMVAAPPDAVLVHVDVFAGDARGRAVENLKVADFEVHEDGAPQRLEDARLVNADLSAAGEAPAPIVSEFDEQAQAARADSRLFAMFLDEFHVAPGPSSERVRTLLTEFVERDLGPRDLVAVLKPLDSLLTIRLTRDREVLREAIGSFDGRKGDYAPRTPFERNYLGGTPLAVEQTRAQVAISALNALTVHIGALNTRRKALVLVSEGLLAAPRRRGLEPLPTLDAVVRSANRYNVAIYAVDPSAGSGEGGASRVLGDLATATDGRVLADVSMARAGLQKMVVDSTVYYMLSYRSARPSDGRFRDVQVRVRRPGVTVRSRKGYWALAPDEALASEIMARASAPALPAVMSEPAHISLAIRPWFGIARGAVGRTRVTFVWEPAPRVPGDRARRVEPARVVLSAYAPDGATIFEGVVRSATTGGGGGGDGTARAAFDVPPGRLRLRLSIEDPTGRVLDTEVRELVVRDLSGTVALGTPEILRARTARDVRALETDQASVPIASREFSRSERLLIRFAAYAADGRPRVSARLLSRFGQAMRDLTVVESGDANQIDLPLAGLAPGEYLVEVAVTGAGKEGKELVGFRVTG